MSAPLDRLRSELSALGSHSSLPIETKENSVAQSLLEEYAKARDKYLQQKLTMSLLSHLKEASDVVPEVPTEEERAALQERRGQVVAQVQHEAQSYQRQVISCQAQQAAFMARKSEVDAFMSEVEASGRTLDNSQDSDEESVDDDEYQAQQDKLLELQQRKAQLQGKLAVAQDKHMKIVKEKREQGSLFAKTESATEISQEALERLQAENAKLAAELQKYSTIGGFYESLRLVMEELRGVRLIAVDKAAGEETGDLTMTVELLNEYTVRLGLKFDVENRCQTLRVVSAGFIGANHVEGPPSADQNGFSMSLPLPNMEDMVESSNQVQDGLRFVIRETMGRLTTLKARVADLAVLQQQVSDLHIGMVEGCWDEQDVSCNVGDVQVIMRLTPDCPLLPGSASLDQLISETWETSQLRGIQDRLYEQNFQSPVDIVQALQKEMTSKI